MFTHTQIWAGIDRLAASFGFSASGLARQAGLDPTSFNKSKRISPDGKPRSGNLFLWRSDSGFRIFPVTQS